MVSQSGSHLPPKANAAQPGKVFCGARNQDDNGVLDKELRDQADQGEAETTMDWPDNHTTGSSDDRDQEAKGDCVNMTWYPGHAIHSGVLRMFGRCMYRR